MTVGENIRKLRRAKGISMYRLAKEAGLTEPVIRGLESGKKRFPRAETLAKVAKVLECKIDDLMQ